jgi:hypothetical protein
MSRVFVSYRRSDTEAVAVHLTEDLVARFGEANVFSDFDGIPAGVSWSRRLDEALDASECVLVLIGKRWLTVRSEGRRRLDDEDDRVRMEIAAALKRGGDVRVIPVLVDTEHMPDREALPSEISDLAGLQAQHLRNREWQHDIEELLGQIGPETKDAPAGGMAAPRGWLASVRRHRWRVALAALVVAIALTLAVTGMDSGPDPGEVAFVNHVERLLNRSASAREQIKAVATAMGLASRGSPTMTGPEMARKLDAVKANRLDMINRANASRAPSAEARGVQAALIKAFTASRRNNDDFDRCLRRPPERRPRISQACLAAAANGAAPATAAKKAFVERYRRLRSRLGVPPSNHDDGTF